MQSIKNCLDGLKNGNNEIFSNLCEIAKKKSQAAFILVMYDFKNNTNNNFSKQVSQEIMIKKILTTRAVLY